MLIIAPAFVSSIIALVFKEQLENYRTLPLWAWVSFVLVVDVAHVYATLFRTYLNKQAFTKNRSLLFAIPLACWVIGSLLYSFNGLAFWTALAYLAVFHFIRQQYGFVALYSRKDPTAFHKYKWLDFTCLYLATIYPLLFWHTHLPRNFNWFVEGDFIESIPTAAANTALILYAMTAFLYTIKEFRLWKVTGFFNIPKNLLIMGTALSWWVGIVALNSDMAFTMTNVLSHGIPYMALIWLYHHKDGKESLQSSNTDKLTLFKNIALTYAPVFIAFLVLLAYIEEGVWDGCIWREHLQFFAPFARLPVISDPAVLAILIPFLSLPQSTHYVLDGFIWRVKDKTNIWSA